ncbi:uncharacterized protein F5147DRAFT_715690 [Suillus discolor]|uniref:DUF6533 domain-containing protein n=1 Tax=Suillus discolor TaxID=1912936 RepID=A0A9P7JPY2_9AGAM|nr:uncharacterized protein F5147DRAFT_715690 [Suillus discolor]KAG2097005.1 hypothetical protein F5147DRAFT_715690 [Suillus discolor]
MDITNSEVQQVLFNMYAILAGNSILIYDHMVTLPEEIDLIWRRPKTLSAMLFLLNRYAALLASISSLIVDFQPIMSDESCWDYSLYRELALFLQGIIICITMAMRTYALYCCSKRLLTWMVIVMVSLAGVCCANTFGQYSDHLVIVPGIGCDETFSKTVAIRIGLAYVAEFIFDLFIFILTVYRYCKIRGLLRLFAFSRENIIDTMFHDGVMFFGAMTLTNIPNILSYYSGSVGLRGSFCTFTGCISVTLICRLMLDLHQTFDAGIFSIPTQDDNPNLAVLTTRIDVESTFSSHN